MNFETVIGLEIHAELKSKTKIFCSCSTAFGAEPNTNTCPICSGGVIEYEYEGKTVKVRLNRIHIEEDAGKLIHVEDEPISLIDYNRVGVPLAEIVTEPDMRSVGEAVEFLRKLKSILEYAGVSDCRMEQGSLRCDANISLRPVGQEEFGTKVELKNINSFRELEKALKKEEKRQRELYSFNEGYKVVQETRRWDAAKGKTISMRSKEQAHDYRYVVEPDLPPIILYDEQIDVIKKSLPEMPEVKRERFLNEYELTEKEVDILISDMGLAMFFEAVAKEGIALDPWRYFKNIKGQKDRIIRNDIRFSKLCKAS